MKNSVTLQGRIPNFENALKFFEGNGEKTAFIRGLLSVPRNYKPEGKEYPDEDLVDFQAYGKTAELINERFQRGSYLMFDGELRRTEKAEDKNGNPIYAHNYVNVTNIIWQYGTEKTDSGKAETKESAPKTAKTSFTAQRSSGFNFKKKAAAN